MEHLHEFFMIPSYYRDLKLEIQSENLMQLLNENPIDYMRHLYSVDSKLFYNVRDELVLRGIGFQQEYQNNYLLDRKYEIQNILYKKDNTDAYKKIDFGILGANNFIERFNVHSDMFFKNIPLEGMLQYTQDVSIVLLKEIFEKAGFSVVPASEYVAFPICEPVTGKPVNHKDKVIEIVPTDDIAILDAPVKYFYEDAIYISFIKYCNENNIQKFSDLTLDFIEKYQYQKHVRTKTAAKVTDLFHEIHNKYNPLQSDVQNAVTLLQNNPFKSIVEYVNLDYLAFVNDFYVADEIGIYQASFPFEKAQHVLNSLDESIAERQQQQFNQLIRDIEDHPKFKYIFNYTLTEIQDILGATWGHSLDLKPYLFDVLDDVNYKMLLNDILAKLSQIKDINDVLEDVANFLKPRELEILLLRRTKTLQEAGEVINVTRERVRQIEAKARAKFANYKKQLHLKMHFEFCADHSKMVTIDDFMWTFEIKGEVNKTLLEIFFDIDDVITHLNELDCYILTSEYERLREKLEKINYSQPIIEIDELIHLFTEDTFKDEEELVDLLLLANNYKRVKNIYVKESISVIARINYLFKHVIKDPIQMDEAGYNLFKKYMEDTFNIPLESSKRAITARIAAGENVILVDGNTFAYHKNEEITDEFLRQIEQVLDERLSYLTYADPRLMFSEYEQLMRQTGVHSPVHLYSIIQLYLSDKYETGHGNTLYIFKANSDRLSAEVILINYLREHGHEVKREVILEDLKWKALKLDQLISRLETVVMVRNNIVKTIESFNFTDEELAELKIIIECELEKGYVFTYDLQFELAFNEKLESLINRCKLSDAVTLAAIVKWLYPNIHGHSKLLYWSHSPITKIEQVLHAEFPNFLSRSELFEFIENKGYSEQTMNRLPTDILKDELFYSYSTTKYINANLLMFTDEVKQSLAVFLDQQFQTKAYCPIFGLAGFTQILLPISSYEWTEFLIGQFAEHLGYRKIQSHHDYRFDKPVLVKNDLPIVSYEQLVFHIVKTEYNGRYHEEDLARYLAYKKMAHNPRRLTNEIYNSPLFKFDSFGFFELRSENVGVN